MANPDFELASFISEKVDPVISELAESMGVTEEQAQAVCLVALVSRFRPELATSDGFTLEVKGRAVAYGSLIEALADQAIPRNDPLRQVAPKLFEKTA